MAYLTILFLSTTIILITYIATSGKGPEKEILSSRSPSLQASCLLLIAILGFIALASQKVKIDADVGIIGDFFGGVLNPSFSLIAIFILIRISKIQHEEFKRSTESLEQQKDMYSIEKFENTLFKLIEQIEQHSENFDVITRKLPDGATKTTSKRVALTQRLRKITAAPAFATSSKTEQLRQIKNAIKKEHDKAGDQNRAMAKRVMLALAHIDKANLTTQQKRFYIDILALSLSIRTIYLLSMYGVSYKGKGLRREMSKSEIAKTVRPDLFFLDFIKNTYVPIKRAPSKP